jgi:hypothetical protein
MKKAVFSIFLFAVLILGFSASEAMAQKSLKGNWVFTLNTPVGALPIPIKFANKGKGVASAPGATNLVYREIGATFSISIEVPAATSPTGQTFTLIIRGTKTDTTAEGILLIITETPDPNRPAADPVKVVIAPGSFTAKRN